MLSVSENNDFRINIAGHFVLRETPLSLITGCWNALFAILEGLLLFMKQSVIMWKLFSGAFGLFAFQYLISECS